MRSLTESTSSHAVARLPTREETYALPARQLPPRWEPAVSPHRHLARASRTSCSRLRITSCSGGPLSPPRGASPLSLLPRRSRPAPRLAAPTLAAGETPTAATTPAAGGELAGAAPEAPRRAESCALTPASGGGPGAAGGSRVLESRLHPRLSGRMVRSAARLEASKSGRARARGSAARWRGWSRVRGCPGGRAARPEEHCLKSIAGLLTGNACVLLQRTTGETPKLCFGGDLRDQPAQTSVAPPSSTADPDSKDTKVFGLNSKAAGPFRAMRARLPPWHMNSDSNKEIEIPLCPLRIKDRWPQG